MVWKITGWMKVAAALATAGLLVVCALPMKNGIHQGLELCFRVLVPSLFPFFCLCEWVNHSPIPQLLSRGCKPLFRLLMGKAYSCGSGLILCVLGGYPMGASALAGLHDQGVIDQKQTRWLSGWLFCPSPVFVMVGVGQGMLGSLTTGVMLWLCCLASMLLTLRLACFAVGVCSPMTLPPGSTAGFVQGVANASGTVITLCGMVALFSGVNQVLCASPLPDVISHICAALGEVTAGCAHVIGRGGSLPAVGFVLMFGGVCTHLQCKLFLGEGMMAYPCYFAIRLVQSALCCALVGLVVTLFPQVVPTFSNSSVTSVQQQSLLPGIGLLLTCVVFLCSLQEPMGLINRKVKHDEKQGLY